MNIQNIEYFLQLAKYEHVSVTADFLNISQPSLSKHIAALERELGLKLFDRTGNRIVLNKNGEQFAQYAQQAIDLLNVGINSAKRSVYDTRGAIRIAYNTYAPILADCIEEYTKLNPLASFQITSMLSSSTELPAFDKLDFVLRASKRGESWQDNDKFWISQQLFQENYVLIYGKDSHLHIPEHGLDIATLEDEYFIVMFQDTLMWSDITYSLCFSAGFYPKVYCQTDEFLVKVHLVASGIAMSIIPEPCLKDALSISPNLSYAALDQYDTARTISIMRRKKSLITEAAQDFWNFVLDYYNLPDDTRD